MGVAVGGLDFKHAVADFEDGNVERAAAQIVDGDFLVALFLEAVRERGRGRLVDDAQHFEAGNAAGVLRGVALAVVKIGGTVMTAWVIFSPSFASASALSLPKMKEETSSGE